MPLPIERFLFDLDEQGNLLITAMEPYLKDAAKEMGDDALADIGLGRSFNLYDPRALGVIRRHVNEYFGAKGVLKTLRDALSAELQEGYKLGESMESMAKRVTAVFSDYTEGNAAHARMIARSETIRASNDATLEAWRQSGVVSGKEWLVGGACCEVCAEIAGDGPIPLDEMFDGREFGPVDGPPLHPNCRCSLKAAMA